MTDTVVETYIAAQQPLLQPVVATLAETVREVAPELKVAFKWGMLLYNFGGSYMRWVCAISTTKKAANLRFLYGTHLADAAHVLRGGKSHLMTWDIATLDGLDLEQVRAYIREAVDGDGAFHALESAD